MSLTRDSILKADDVKRESVPVPEWGGDVLVQSMSGEERDAWEGWCLSQHDAWGSNVGPNIRASLLLRCLVDDKGLRLFTDDDVLSLGAKNSTAIVRLYDIAARLSGVTKQDQEDLAKN